MSNATIDSYVQQYFGDNAPPALADVATSKGLAIPLGISGRPNANITNNVAKNYIENLANTGDFQNYYNDATNVLSTMYFQSSLGGQDTSNILKNIQSLAKSAPNYGLNTDDVAKKIGDTVLNAQTTYKTAMENFGGDKLINSLLSVATNPITWAALISALPTGGASLAAEGALASEGAVGAESAGIGDIGLSGTEAGNLDFFNANPTDTSYLNDFAPTDTGTAQLGSGTSLSANASDPLSPYYATSNPTAQANLGTVSNLVGGGAESNLATLDSNPLIPTTGAGIGGAELGATGSIIGSGEGLGVQTLPETLAPTGLNGLTPNDLLSQPTDIPNPSVTISDVADAAKTAKNIANLLKATNTRQQQLATTQQNLTKSQALSNMLRNQVQGTEAPTPYKAPNFFTFTPEQPVQNNLASLLRNNYGNQSF